ncbi:MAG: SIMPL domain-containing protein [Anaerolineae bacterium]|nr:SIMPL domain-containing protein [Anaerolineae bacterium]
MDSKISRMGMVMMLLLTVATLLLGCSGLAQAGEGKSYNSDDAESAYIINVSASGDASITPDIADVRFGVESINTDAGATLTDNSTKMAAILAAVKALGIEDKDVQTAEYNMWIEQIYEPERGIPTGELRYHVTNQLIVRVRDINKVGALLETVLQAGANNVSGVSFGVDDTTALQSQARKEALENARAKAEELAAGLGVKVGKVRQISEATSGYSPAPMVLRDSAISGKGEAISIASGSYNVTVDVQVVFDIIQ